MVGEQREFLLLFQPFFLLSTNIIVLQLEYTDLCYPPSGLPPNAMN